MTCRISHFYDYLSDVPPLAITKIFTTSKRRGNSSSSDPNETGAAFVRDATFALQLVLMDCQCGQNFIVFPFFSVRLHPH